MDKANFISKEWRLIDGESHYYVSSEGDVWNSKRDYHLTGNPDKTGYKRVNIKGQKYYIHVLVCTAFNGTKPKGKVVDHINRNKTCNHYSNLRWVTPHENNTNRQIRKATTANKFTYQQWRVIIDRYLTGMYSQHELSEWANKKFNRNSHVMVYNALVNGRTFPKYYAELNEYEIASIQETIHYYSNGK